ncbi:MAG: hypothetical protein KGJ59_03065 [Bacteroidota bacterium]|nr:hypothetical protein [Bacteroidota bacterium]
MKRTYLFLFLVPMIFANGCSMIGSLITPPAKIPDMTRATDKEKSDLVGKNIVFSTAHKNWAKTVAGIKGSIFQAMFADPEIDSIYLKKVKKAAVLSFAVRVHIKSKLDEGSSTSQYQSIDMTPLQSFVDTMYDQFVDGLKRAGLEVVPAAQVTDNPDYKTLEYNEVAEGGNLESEFGGWYEGLAEARGLKEISAIKIQDGLVDFETAKIYGAEAVEKAKSGGITKMIRSVAGTEKQVERAKLLMKAAKSLGVDAVFLVDNHVSMELSGFTGAYDLKFAIKDGWSPGGISADMLSGDDLTSVWSAQTDKCVEVSTEAKNTSSILGVHDYQLDKVAPDLTRMYGNIVELISFKLKSDRISSTK